MKFRQLLRILRAHSGLITLVMFCALAVATFITGVTTPKYTATSSILVDMAESKVNVNSNAPLQPYSSFLATQIDLITSQAVALKVVDQLQLVGNTQLQARYLGVESPLQEALKPLRSMLNSLVERLSSNTASDATADHEASEAPNERFRLADRLLNTVSVRPSPDSNVLHVAYSASTANAAATAANTIVKAYTDIALELNVNPARASSEWLDAQVERLGTNVHDARARLSEFQQRTGIIGENGTEDDSARLNDLNAQLVAAQSQNHPAIQALKSDLARAQAKLNDLPPQLGPNHPTFKRAQGEVAALRAQLENESEQLAAGLRREIATQKQSMLGMKRQHAELATLKDSVDTAQQALDDAAQRANQAKMNSEVTQTNVSVVRMAVPPRRPATPNPLFNFSLATMCGLALGIGLALWREVVGRFVRSADDLRDFLGVQVLGVLHDGPRSTSGRGRLSNGSAGHRAPLLAMNR